MKRLLAVAIAAVALAPQPALAQDTNPFAFGTYYQCDQNREAFADQIQEFVVGPILDGHVEAGQLLSWGWLAHRIGGDWRRVEYMIAPDRATLLSVRNEIIEALQEPDMRAATTELTDICPDHDDYIWQVTATSSPDALTETRPAAGISTYYECDIAREQRADELVAEVFAPVLNAHVGAGGLNGWSWLQHDTGGKFRRLLSLDAADGAALYAARDALFPAIQEANPEAGAEFSDICWSHEDYQWDITISRP